MSVSSYKCTKRGATGVKLWREHEICHTDLFCAPCGFANQNKPFPKLEEWGQGRQHTQIGWLVAAVPVNGEVIAEGFWGYTSVPEDRCEWWYKLPNFPKN
jgi:Zn ribbon nucleic-acid-binding protein